MKSIHKQLAYNISKRTSPIKYIVIHDTGNPGIGADAKSHFEYFNGGDRESSADIFVDDAEAWYVNDYINSYTWHCGDGNGRYGITNGNSVGVEFCVNMDGNRERTVANTIEVVRSLMREHSVPIERVVRHYDASRKLCPASMSKGGWLEWYEFKKRLTEEGLTMTQYEELKNEIEKLREENTPVIYNYIDENMPNWAKPTVRKLADRGVLRGDDNGLKLTEDLMRMLVINDRSGLYE